VSAGELQLLMWGGLQTAQHAVGELKLAVQVQDKAHQEDEMRTRGYLLVAILLVGLLLFPALATAHPGAYDNNLGPGQRPKATAKVEQSVVQIIAADEGRGGRLIAKWSGTGTIISADGLILTNCQVAMPRLIWDDPNFDYDLLIVALAASPDEPPEAIYLAEVAQYDAGLDLAVLQISQTLDGSPVDTKKLKLPALALGDSDAVATGDELKIFGYAGPAGEPVSSVSGTVTGFSTGRGIKGRAWIRTNAEVEGGFSGGPAVSQDGKVVGVIAAGAATSADEVLQCRYDQDTNGDGVVDQNDTCSATGGTIGTLRPINLALPLIKAASSAVAPEPPPAPQPKPTPKVPANEPSVSRLIFAPEIDEYEQPVTVVEALPSGVEAVYLFFDYQNFEDGASWQPLLAIDGEPQEDVWPAEQWEGGPQGTWWIVIESEEGLEDGTYEVTITYDGETLGSAAIEVGGPEEQYPAFSHIVFSGAGEEGYLLPASAKEVQAAFRYSGMTRTTPWSYIWYFQGEELESGDGRPLSRASGTTSLTLASDQGFEAGTYRLELYIDKRLAATADFVLGGGAEGPSLGPIIFAEGVDHNDNPIRPGTTFKSGIKALYGFFDYQGMEDGLKFSAQWSRDGERGRPNDFLWEGGESGNWWVGLRSKVGSLPEGEYQLELFVEDELLQSGTCTIGGKGPRPTPRPTPPAEGVEVIGRITDATTGRGIAGAYFVVLQPGVSLEEFENKEQIYTAANTDRQGYFKLPDPLARGESYSMFATAEGYRPVGGDDILVPEDAESPLEFNLELEKVK